MCLGFVLRHMQRRGTRRELCPVHRRRRQTGGSWTPVLPALLLSAIGGQGAKHMFFMLYRCEINVN